MTFTAIPGETEMLATRVIGAAIEVHKTLGPGFLERVYQHALCFELTERGIRYDSEKPIAVQYKAIAIGGQRADLVIEDRIIVELKAVSRFDPIHEAMVMSYLRTTGLRLGLMMNFHAPTLKEGLKRIVL
jgi:GxxExxY protein